MTEPRSRPIIFGEVLFDRFPDGSVVLGGAPFNLAWNLHAFGLNPLLISRVGDDPLGHRIRSAMKNRGMDTSGLQLDSAHPTGRVEISIHEGEPTYDILPDQAYDFIDPSQFPPLGDIPLLYHGTLGVRNPQAAAALEVLRQRAAGKLFLDVNLRPPWWNLEATTQALSQARWVKLNSAEMERLAPSAEAMQRDHKLALVILTHGAKGAEALDHQGVRHQVSPPSATQVVDTVGAGDGFASVVITGILGGWELPLTLQRAQAFASALVGNRGATCDDPEFYRAITQSWQEQS